MVFFAAVILSLSIFSLTSSTQSISLQERLELDRREYVDKYVELKYSKSSDERAQAAFEKFAMCKITGQLCHDDPYKITDEDQSQSSVGKTISFFTLPLTNMPASGVETVQSTIARAGLVPQAFAADGSGFGGLAPYGFIWEQMRNVTYIILVLGILFAGFALMFRSTINATVAVSIENMLPKIIITMILIQTSFAIAGFLIDGMYVVSGLVVSVFGPLVFPKKSLTDLINMYLYSSPINLVKSIISPGGIVKGFWDIMYTVPDALMSIFGWQARAIFETVMMVVAIKYVKPMIDAQQAAGSTMKTYITNFVLDLKGILKAIRGGTAGVVVYFLGRATESLISYLMNYGIVLIFVFFPQVVIGLVLFFSLLVAAWKIFSLMLMAYIRILLYVIFAPVIIMLDLVPGKSGFKQWIMSMLGELAVFPLFIAVTMTATLIMGYETSGIGLRLPYLIGIDPKAFTYLIAVSILAMSPAFIDKFRKSIFGSGIDLAGDAQKALMQGLPWITKFPIPGLRDPLPFNIGNAYNEVQNAYEGKIGKSKDDLMFDEFKKWVRTTKGP